MTVGVREFVAEQWAQALNLPPRLTVSEFSDRELIVPTGRLAGSRWRTDFAPYQRGIMDAFHEPGIEHVVVMGSSQWGKTSIALNLVAYHVAHDPCPILVVQPTRDPMAKEFSVNRLNPLIEASPVLRDKVGRRRAKDSSNTTYSKTYRGGMIAIGGANSASSLASRSIRVLLLDEVDRYPLELAGEGNTIEIALKRTTVYRGVRRILVTSSPTIVNAPIHEWFRRGDRRLYFVPCAKCGHMAPYRWRNIRWADDDPRTARIHCPACDYGLDDVERLEVLGGGEWRSTSNDGEFGVALFHVWEAYSPFSSLDAIVGSFLSARKAQKAGDPSRMHTWQNTTLGEPVEPDTGEGVEPHVLISRRELFEAPAPAGVVYITMGVDTQDDRLELLVVGWGVGEEAWLLDRRAIEGDTSQPEPWDRLSYQLGATYTRPEGRLLPIGATCIDSGGHRTNLVYEFVRKHGRGRVFATIGRPHDRPIVSSPTRPRRGRGARPVPLYTIGVDAAKATLMSRLQLAEGPGTIHVPLSITEPGVEPEPASWADDELAAQLTAERLVTRHHLGRPVMRWVKIRPRNEALDCWVLAFAALKLMRPDLERFRKAIAGEPETKRSPPPKRSGWIDRERTRGWLDRRRRR